jgi:hypothetical protein
VSTTPRDQAARDAIFARLARSRAKIRRLLEPPTRPPDGARPTPSASPGGFPRSRTMQALMSGRGLGAVGAAAGGLLLARPALAWRLIRMLPTGAVARMLVVRIVRALGESAKPAGRARERRREDPGADAGTPDEPVSP